MSSSTTACCPRPTNSHVSQALCIGLVITSAKCSRLATGFHCLATLRPFSVSGISVVPVCLPFKLHSVSPCRIRQTLWSGVNSSPSLPFVHQCRRRHRKENCARLTGYHQVLVRGNYPNGAGAPRCRDNVRVLGVPFRVEADS